LMDEDMAIIERVLQGNVEAFSELVGRYQRPVVSMVAHLLNDRHECEDVAQDVFLAAYRNLASFDPARSRFSTWIFTIARNRSLNLLKKKRPSAMPAELQSANGEQAPEKMDRDEMAALIDRHIDGLPEDQRTAFILSELEGLSYEDIAEIESVPLGTVKSRINRAKEKLREALLRYCGDEL
jgi:RNA polymerase sigma-70 factor, ECF subfamily